MYRMRQEMELSGQRRETATNGAAAVVEEVESVPTFSEGEEEEEEEEMEKQWSSLLPIEWVRRKLLPLAAASSDDDDWRVGAWTSSAGVCKIGRRGRGERAAAAGGKKAALSAGVGRESSFESLDISAAEVLGRRQALESCSSLASCAFGTATNSSGWEESVFEVEKDKQQEGRSQDWDLSEHPLLSSSKGLGGAAMDRHHNSDHTLDILRVLKEIINSSDYAAKLSVDKMPMQDQNVMHVKENVSEKHKLRSVALARANLWNELSAKSALDAGHVLSTCSALFNNCPCYENSRDAPACCRIPANLESSHRAADGEGGVSLGGIDVKGSVVATLERSVQTELTVSKGSKIRPPKGQKFESLRPSNRPRGRERRFIFSPHDRVLPARRKSNLVALQRKRIGSWENSRGTKDPTHSERRKLVLPSKPPKWKGLSTAFSVVKSICHGAGEAGVVEAKARPLLIIAGKCIFRTTAPLDTPRPCTAFHQRKSLVPRPAIADEKRAPATRSVDASTEDTRKALSDARPTSIALLPVATTSDMPPQRPSTASNCGSDVQSIMHWPPAVAELDAWISEIVNEWLDKDGHLAAVANSSPCSPPVTFGSPVVSNTLVCFEENQEVLGPLPAATALDLPVHLPILHTELIKRVSAPRKVVTELDTKIQQAQTAHDLCQILQPISLAVMSSVLDNKVKWDMKISPASIIHEFGKDDIVQDFKRQIHILEEKIEDLKASTSKQEYSVLFQRLQTYGL